MLADGVRFRCQTTGSDMIMRQAILSMLRAFKRDNSGNIAMIVAFGMPALIGAGGLSVDITQWYMWKRELQHSVDQAAIGGAWAMANANSAANYKTRAQQEFDANQAITKGFSTTPTIALANFAGGTTATNYLGGTENSVVVSAKASKLLPFSGFLMGNSASVTVRSQASFAKGQTYNACLVATAGSGTGISIGGNASVNAQCGLAALSCSAGAVNISGSAIVETGSIATCGTATVPAANQGVVAEHVQGLSDAYAGLATPNNPNQGTAYNCKSQGTGQNKTTIATLSAGTYTGGITVKCTTNFGPGIYVIDGGTLDLTANYIVTGSNVMFVLKNGASIKFGGNGNGNSVNLSPLGATGIAGTSLANDPNKDIYENMLVFEDKNNNPGSPGHMLNGNSTSMIEGLMYLPSGNITVNGTANVSSQCLQITAYTITVLGNASLSTLCPTNETTQVGVAAATVRLVG
jgi:Flp pilus assembly protein TadG